MDRYFKQESPWLTHEREAIITAHFKDSADFVSLEVAHRFIEEVDENLGYDYALFIDDLRSFSRLRSDYITCSELILFLKEMQ